MGSTAKIFRESNESRGVLAPVNDWIVMLILTAGGACAPKPSNFIVVAFVMVLLPFFLFYLLIFFLRFLFCLLDIYATSKLFFREGIKQIAADSSSSDLVFCYRKQVMIR